jgi:hypothetical protein
MVYGGVHHRRVRAARSRQNEQNAEQHGPHRGAVGPYREAIVASVRGAARGV